MKTFVTLLNGLLATGEHAPTVYQIRTGMYLVFISCAQIYMIVFKRGDEIRTFVKKIT